ncbi:MAG: hypothetical protein JSW52_12285 [Candidatus Coatesbacteria bacterium]|nr:MAG: hypothetical protein JSW52_12285 [Candidatus Coatesbacteria bacterium]
MRIIICSIVLLTAYVTPAGAYEVIFHEGFEGDQFPSAGWTVYGWVEHSLGGYESEWCAELIDIFGYGSELKSVEIPIIGGELFEFRIYASAYASGMAWHYASIHFDEGSDSYFELPDISFGDGYPWTSYTIQEHIPEAANTVHFWFTCYVPEDE